MKKFKKSISIVTSVTTTLWLSGVAMLVPTAVLAVDVVDGDLIQNSAAEGMAQFDIYIVKVVGDEKYKRLILSPHVFESYEHFDKNGNGDNWDDVMDVDQATMDAYTTTDLVREDGNDKVYRLHAAEGADTGDKYWLNMTAAEFTAVFDADAIYTINSTDTAGYTAGADVADASATFPPAATASTGTLTVSLAADTPAAGVAVGNAARVPFTKINLTATGGDVIVDSLVVQRTSGVAQDGAFSSLDIIDVDTNLPINVTSKTLNSLHQATFNDDFTVSNGTTKSIILAGNMTSSLTAYAGEVPTLSLAGVTVKDDADTSASLPITGNAMTINSTITIGTATIQRGAYTNATSTSIQVGKEDYTYFSFQVAAGSAEKVEFSQVKVYQEGSASLGSDLVGLELLQDGTKIADGVIASSKYANFSFDTITLDKGQTAQFQVKADVDDGSARTIQLGIYKTTDLLVKGVTYGYNITPTYSGTGRNPTNPVLHDNQFTISNGTLQVSRSSTVGAGNVSVANDQILGAFEFECKGEAISVSALTLTVTSGGGTAQIEDALSGLELVDPNGNVVSGPTDITNNALTVAWTDTFTVPVGTTVYKVRGDLSTSGGWASDDTVYVSFTPSAMTATGDVTGNAITATPGSAIQGNTQTVKAAGLTVNRNSLPTTDTIVSNQNDLVLVSWNFDATDSGEDIRVTSLLVAARGQAASNTDALTVFLDNDKDGEFDEGSDTTLSPVNDAVSSAAATSTFAFDDPIIIEKGTNVHVALKGDKDTTNSDDTENWGLTDATASVIAYGVTTGNSVAESLTANDGPTLTSTGRGALTIETTGNPTASLVLSGSTGNVFTNIGLTADYEDLDLDELTVFVGDGGYAFDAGTGQYDDTINVGIYDGSTLLKETSISSANGHTFNFSKGDVVVPKGVTNGKVLTLKVDMGTINKSRTTTPKPNADIKVGIGGDDGVKTTGQASNLEITGSSFETYRSSTSSEMILKAGRPVVTLPKSGAALGATETLSDGTPTIYAFKVEAEGGDVLLYRVTFAVATSGSEMTITNMYIENDGDTIKAAANPTELADGDKLAYYTATFNSADVSNGDDKEAIKIDEGTSETFKVIATIAGASANESLTTYLIGDTASTSSDVNTDNTADAFGTPNGDFASDLNNFVWSDNWKQNDVGGTGGNNATSTAQWYNGHLVSGLGNVVSTTSYVISTN